MTREQQRMAFDRKFAETILLERGEILPMFVIHSAAAPLPVGIPLRNDEEKAYDFMHALCIVHEADGLSMISEAWMRTLPPNPSPEEIARGAANCPDRVEVVIVAQAWIDDNGAKQGCATVQTIVRDASGRVVGLDDREASPGTTVQGVLFDILPDRPPTDTEKAEARALVARTKAWMP
jgi:hypothetical protein